MNLSISHESKEVMKRGSRSSRVCFLVFFNLVTFGPQGSCCFVRERRRTQKKADITSRYRLQGSQKGCAANASCWEQRTCERSFDLVSAVLQRRADRTDAFRGSRRLLPIRRLCRPRDPFAFRSSLACSTACSVKAAITPERKKARRKKTDSGREAL